MRKDKYTPYPYLFSPRRSGQNSLSSLLSRATGTWSGSGGGGPSERARARPGRVARLGCQGGVASALDTCMPRPSPVALLLRASLAPGLSRDIPSQQGAEASGAGQEGALQAREGLCARRPGLRRRRLGFLGMPPVL